MIFLVTLKSRVFDTSNFSGNSLILLKVRGQSLSNDAALLKVCYFSSFSASVSNFSLSWLKMAGFEGDDQVKSLTLQFTKEMPIVCLKWVMNQSLKKSYFQDMKFSFSFSRFMHFLTKNGWFCMWINLQFSIFLPLIEISF